MTPPRAAGVSTRPARSTSRVISYATRPRSQVEAARTARLAPLLIAMMTSTPRCISTTVWTTAPPSNTRDAPWVRLVRPDVTAASWSARSCGKPALNASGRPSEDTTTACATSGTRSTKLVISQLRSCAGRPGVLICTPLVARSYRFLLLVSLCLGLGQSSVLGLLGLGWCGGAALAHASLEARHAAASNIRRPDGRLGFRLLAPLAAAVADRTRHQISSRHAPGQAGLRRISGRGRRDRLSRAPALVGGRGPRTRLGRRLRLGFPDPLGALSSLDPLGPRPGGQGRSAPAEPVRLQ